jgi:hypothetical protein
VTLETPVPVERQNDTGLGRRLPGLILALASVVPGVAAAAWVASALPLLVLHIYRPLPAIVLGLLVALLLGRPAVRVARAAVAHYDAVPWWVLIAIAIIVTTFGVLAFAHSAEDVLVRRDPGSYAMSADWLSKHGTVNMGTHPQLWGPPDNHLLLASQGFYEQGSHDIPQFMTGVPVLLSVGGWIAGLSGVLHGNAIIGTFALLAFAGVAVRLVGARWAPLAVLALALAQPELDVIRATYSEPAAQLIVFGGLAMVIDALVVGRLLPSRAAAATFDRPDTPFPQVAQATPPPTYAKWDLFVGGLVLGLVFVVRIDAVADLLPLIPFIGWLGYHRVAGWRHLMWGVVAGLAFGALDCLVLTFPYAEHVGPDLRKVGYGFAPAVVLTVVGVSIAREVRRSATTAPWISVRIQAVGAMSAVFLVGLFFFLRPHLMTMRANPESGGANYVEQVQKFQNMAVDPTRSYYENATIWLSWYIGWATLALAFAGACWLAYEQISGRRRLWAPAFLMFVGMTTAVLFAPSITPDHPWADRRFVPVVLPGLILFAVAAIAVVVHKLGRYPWTGPLKHVVLRAAQPTVAVLATALVVVPTWIGSRDVLYSKTEVGEPGLVKAVCATLRPGDLVLAIGNRARSEWPGTLRVMCGVNAAYLDDYDNAPRMSAIAARAKAEGGRLMLLAESTADKDAAALDADWPAKPTATLITSEATHTLVKRPGKPVRFGTEMWVGEYRAGGA